MRSYAFFFLFGIALLIGCSEDAPTPKPRGYFRIDFPEKKYEVYSSPCGYKFEYPTYAKIQKDSFPGAESCWINIEFEQFKGTLHISYKDVTGNLRNLTEDSRTLAMKHAVKAQEIEEEPFTTSKNVYGWRYDIRGNVASSVQFYLTDSVRHFIRMSLYFNVIPNVDSLAPILAFLRQDIDRLIESFEWTAMAPSANEKPTPMAPERKRPIQKS